MDYGHWTLSPDAIYREDAIAFVYEIEHLPTGKKYIGKKLMQSNKKLKPLKGKTRARRVVKESDWKSYTSSSNLLNEWLERDGKDAFKFTILCFCASKSHVAYEEARMQIEKKVLFDENYLNGIINIRLSKIVGFKD